MTSPRHHPTDPADDARGARVAAALAVVAVLLSVGTLAALVPPSAPPLASTAPADEAPAPNFAYGA